MIEDTLTRGPAGLDVAAAVRRATERAQAEGAVDITYAEVESPLGPLVAAQFGDLLGDSDTGGRGGDVHDDGRDDVFQLRHVDLLAESQPVGCRRQKIHHDDQRHHGLQRQEVHQQRNGDQRRTEAGDAENDVGEQPDQRDGNQGF